MIIHSQKPFLMGVEKTVATFNSCTKCVSSPLYKYAMPVWVSWWNVSPTEDGNHPPEGRHSIRIHTLAWHICFIIPNKPQFGNKPIKTTMTAGRSSENGGRFAGWHFAGEHDGMANLCKPITAYDFHVRYNKGVCTTRHWQMSGRLVQKLNVCAVVFGSSYE